MADQKLQIILEAKDQASSVIQKAGGAIKDNLGKISAVASVAAAGIAAFGKSSIDAYVESETAQRQLQTAIVNVSGGTMQQVAAINEVTGALQKKAGIDADALNTGAAQLATFGLQSDSVVNLTKTLADLTVNQDGVTAGAAQYEAQALNINKALLGSFGALEKQGIYFTEAQQKVLLYGTETEKVAAIQEGFSQNLKETTDTVAGTAEAMQGSLKQSIGDVSESIGAALLPAFTSLIESLQPVIDNFGKWAAENPELIATIVKIVGVVVATIAVLYPLSLAIGVVSTALAFLAANPIVLVIAAIVALGAAIYLLITNWEEVKVKALEVWAKIKEFVVDTLVSIGEAITKFGASIKEAIHNGMEGVKQAWTDGWNTLKGAVDTIGAGIMSVINGIINGISAAVGKIKELASAAMSAAKSVAGGAMGGASGGAKSSGKSGTRASGGNVYGGQSYLVGEKGPEQFSPGQSGRIIPNNRMGGGVNVSVNVSGNTVLGSNMRQFATMIGDQLMNELRMQIKLA